MQSINGSLFAYRHLHALNPIAERAFVGLLVRTKQSFASGMLIEGLHGTRISNRRLGRVIHEPHTTGTSPYLSSTLQLPEESVRVT